MGAFDQRPRFFEGQYLTAADLSAVVDYLRTSHARFALGAHTWGIGIGLDLAEQPAPGAANRREVILQPGWAIDGLGRNLVVQQPTRLSESLFAGIGYNGNVDDPTHPGGAVGRLVQVWLAYSETGGQGPAAGFETCDNGNSFSRVQEGVDFVVGTPPLAEQRAPIVIGAETLDALEALSRFDATALPLYDTSVPHQDFGTPDRPPRWLVPIGYVRWVAVQGATGYFIDRALVPADGVDARIRAARRYGGTVTENIEAAAGAIVLRKRSDKPDAPHRFATLLTAGQPLETLLQDLAWIEGGLRVEGDARLAGSRLLLRNADGLDESTDLSLARWGDGTGTPGARQLRALIGPDTQSDNRFVVGPITSGVTPDQTPQFVVQSNGRIGINVLAPLRTLHARGDAVRLEDGSGAKRIEMRTDGAAVDLQSDTHQLSLRSSGPAATHRNQVIINAFKPADGEVGIGTATPAYGLDVDEPAVRFKLDSGNGGQLLFRSDAAAAGTDRIFLQASNGAGNAASPELRLTGPLNANMPLLSAWADTTFLRGKLGVNEPSPAADVQMHVRGPRLRLQSVDSAHSIDLRTDGSAVDLQSTTSDLYLRSSNPGGPPTRNIVMNPYAEDGNVGIGTSTPLQKLHVAGNFIRIEGAAQEQAYIGGDGSMTQYGTKYLGLSPDVQIGSFNTAVHQVHLYNVGGGYFMEVVCDDLVHVSDAAAKKDIEPLVDGLACINALRGVRYRMRSRPGRARIGVVAQEVAKVLPEAVVETRHGAAVSYTTLVPVLVEAVKALSAKVDVLQARLDALQPPPAAPTGRARKTPTKGTRKA